MLANEETLECALYSADSMEIEVQSRVELKDTSLTLATNGLAVYVFSKMVVLLISNTF